MGMSVETINAAETRIADVGVATSLFHFAFCMVVNKRKPEFNKSFNDYIQDLKSLAIDENWGNSDATKSHPVLHNYIHYTFDKIAQEYNTSITDKDRQKRIAMKDGFACFNTGLFTRNYERIFCVFEENRVPGRQPWYLRGFFPESDLILSKFSDLPERASYFDDASELIYDYRLSIRPNKRHILEDEENVKRLPLEYQSPEKRAMLSKLFDGAVLEAAKKVSANYKLAVPQYYKGSMQLLIPLCLTDDKPELALAIQRDGQVYQSRTCLTLEMAYNNARLIVKPESNWLELS